MHVINFSHQNCSCCRCFLQSPEDLPCSIYNMQQRALVGQSMVCSQGVGDGRRNWLQPPDVDWFVTGLYWLNFPTETSWGGGASGEQSELH